MVMSEVSLCRIEELLLGPAHELRPALAVRDPTVMLVLAESHFPHRSIRPAALQTRSTARCWCPRPPVAAGPNPPNLALAIRFHNVAGASSRR